MTATNNNRLLSLDILRGMTVALMILVNNSWGDAFEMLQHSAWNGLTPCDLVFPFFLFMMGITTFLSLSKYQFQPTLPVIRKILRRGILLFLIGLFINYLSMAIDGHWLSLDYLRYWAVLQRIAVCYLVVSLLALTVSHRFIPLLVVVLLGIYASILLLFNGYATDASNIALQIDLHLFGYDHLYHHTPIDPEGLLGTISAIAHTLIGFLCGKWMKAAATKPDKAIVFFSAGTIMLFSGWFLSYGLPINKCVWSPSYVLITCGFAALLQGLLIYIIDLKGHSGWASFFHVFGVNPLALYAGSEILAILLSHFGCSSLVYDCLHNAIPFPKIASLLYAISYVLLLFLIGYILYRKKIFIKL